MKLTFKAEQDMAFITPMVSQVTWCILYQTNPDIIELLRTPVSFSGLARVFRCNNVRPVRSAKRNVLHVHNISPEWI
jgi:hypothetical protein